MATTAHAIETTAIVDDNHSLKLDTPLPIGTSTRVRVIILLPQDSQEVDDAEWLKAASTNPAFDFLKEPEEDIYTLADGKPFHDDG